MNSTWTARSPLPLHFIVDIETTGIEPEHNEVLQIAMLPVAFDVDRQRWRVVRPPLDFVVATDAKPKSEWAAEHMGWLFDKCNTLYAERKQAGHNPKMCSATVRKAVVRYMRETYPLSEMPKYGAELMGWNVGAFDLPFLSHHGHLNVVSRAGKIKVQGDVSYRVYELQGAMRHTAALLGWSLNDTFEAMQACGVGATDDDCDEWEVGRAPHDAVYDCITNLYRVNGLLKLAQG